MSANFAGETIEQRAERLERERDALAIIANQFFRKYRNPVQFDSVIEDEFYSIMLGFDWRHEAESVSESLMAIRAVLSQLDAVRS